LPGTQVYRVIADTPSCWATRRMLTAASPS